MGLRSTTRSHAVIRGLLEFFWDSTNSFHFPWGEMTITPLDFSIISGLPSLPRGVRIDGDLRISSPETSRLLGPVIERIRPTGSKHGGSSKSIGSLLLKKGFEMEGTFSKKKVRIFMLILLSSIISPERSSRSLMRFLPSLEDLSQMGTCD